MVDAGLLNLVLQAGEDLSCIPETYRIDKQRLVNFFNDWQDITILSCILLIFKGIAGPKCTPSDMKLAKSQLWTLLNDTETTMKHVTLKICDSAGKIRGSVLSEKECTALENLVDKTLSPGSKMYSLLQTRIKFHIYHPLQEKMKKHSLDFCSDEISALSKKILALSTFNKKVFGRLYGSIISMRENHKILSDSDLIMSF